MTQARNFVGPEFPGGHDVLILEGDLWKAFQSKPEYQNKLMADRESYAWDRIIETFCHDLLHDNLEFAPGLTATERAIRVIAKEDRFARRVVGKSFTEFLDQSGAADEFGSVEFFIGVLFAIVRKLERQQCVSR